MVTQTLQTISSIMRLEKVSQSFAEIGTEADFGRYTYEFYVQRIGNHTTLNGFNFIPQSTEGARIL